LIRSNALLPIVLDPDVPAQHNEANVQQRSITLDWNFGSTSVVNSSIVYYVDITSAVPQWQTTEITYKLTGLTPGHTYVYYLCVQSFDKTACSDNHTAITRE